jgi:ParB-like chromosome segregation protein Spo0J
MGSEFDCDETFTVSVESLVSGDSPRLLGQDTEHTRRLAQYDGALPPILVSRVENRIIDGLHRLEAARLRGDQTISVRYFDGDANDAFVVAVRVNAEHGLPLTLVDREAAAKRIILSHPDYSDRAIGVIAKLSARTVGRLRADLRQTHGVAERTARIGRDGRARPIDAAQGRLAAHAMIIKNPQASLREIARTAGISPATARDVRKRVERGDSPVPAARRTETADPLADALRGPMRARKQKAEREGRDQEQLLRSLNRDPSLRFSETGRALLRWVLSRASGPVGWEDVVDTIPSHSSYLVAEVARGCAEQWLAFADRIERRLGKTG